MTKSVAQMSQFRDDPYLKTFLEQDLQPPEVFPRLGRAQGILGAYIERFTYGRMGLEESLRQAEQDVNALLRRRQATEDPIAQIE